jgi:1-deoxy-D-xylulose-5-phosphate synthase
VHQGSDVCLIGVGKLVAACEDAAERLDGVGVRASVWDARVVAPLDPSMLAEAACHPVVLVAEDGVAEGGVAAHVRSALERSSAVPPPVVVGCGVPLVHVPHGRADDLLAGFGLDGAGLADAALRARRAAGCATPR